MAKLLFVKHGPRGSEGHVLHAGDVALSDAVSWLRIESHRWLPAVPGYPGREDLPKGYKHAFVEVESEEAKGTKFKPGVYSSRKTPVEIMAEYPPSAERVRQLYPIEFRD
jgi:hypothetical protein